MPLNDEQVSTQGQARIQVNPWNPVAAISRCWRWALPIGIVLAGVTAFSIISTFVPMYRASHILEANQDFKVFKGVNPVYRNLAMTEPQLILHPIVLDPVLSDETLQKAPSLSDPETAETNLKKNMRITSGGNEYRLVISYEDSDRESAASVCNAIASSYLKQRNKFDEKRTNNLAKWLAEETDTWEKKVEEHQEAVKELQAVNWGPQTTSLENDNKFTLVTKLRSRVNDVSLEIEILDAQIGLHKKNGDLEPNSDSVPERSLEDSEAIRKRELLAAELKVVQRWYDRKRVELDKFGGASAELQFAIEDLSVATSLLNKLRDRVATIDIEHRSDGAVRTIALATIPTSPVNSMPFEKAGWWAAAAFLAPFLLGYLLGVVATSREPTGLTDEND